MTHNHMHFNQDLAEELLEQKSPSLVTPSPSPPNPGSPWEGLSQILWFLHSYIFVSPSPACSYSASVDAKSYKDSLHPLHPAPVRCKVVHH